jgi:hypothetical protein
MDFSTRTLTQQLDRTITLLAAKGPMEYQALRSDVTFNDSDQFVSTSDEAELSRTGSHDIYGDSAEGVSSAESSNVDEFIFGSSVPYLANQY